MSVGIHIVEDGKICVNFTVSTVIPKHGLKKKSKILKIPIPIITDRYRNHVR